MQLATYFCVALLFGGGGETGLLCALHQGDVEQSLEACEMAYGAKGFTYMFQLCMQIDVDLEWVGCSSVLEEEQ